MNTTNSIENELSATRSNTGAKRKELHMCAEDLEEKLEEQSESPEENCVNWDVDCEVINVPLSWKIYGHHLMPTCVSHREPPPKPVAKLSNQFKSAAFTKEFKSSWTNGEVLKSTDKIETITDPWKMCVINDLLQDDSVLREIRQEFYELDWNRRKMDLYDFHQSLDLKYIKSCSIRSIYDFLKNEIMPWISEVMGFELNNISATCSYYCDTDYLLVHDDRQEDRVVAFVLYLSDVDEWRNNWGGALQLFDRDEIGQPNKPTRKVYPKHNRLVLFPVSDMSYHQVEEVTTKNYTRLSINGWFHGKIDALKDTPEFLPPVKGIYSENFLASLPLNIKLNEWVNSNYLTCSTMRDIQEHVQKYSEISLINFFHKETFAIVTDALPCQTNTWLRVGPPNRMCYDVLVEEDLPWAVSNLLDVFRSNEMFDLLHKYTNLDVNENNGRVRYEIQRWTSGCYSLLSDYEWNKRQELDVILFLGCQDIVGGEIQYVIQDEEEIQQALITLPPQDNCLNLVFRDTARITSYVSKYTSCTFYILVCCYTEVENI